MKSQFQKIVIGCNYHTTWQSNPSMRFVLESVDGDNVILSTRRTNKRFTTKKDSLIFVNSAHNCRKAEQIERNYEKL